MISRDAAEWPGFRAWLQLEIETCRCTLESPNCRAIAEADQLRGKIMAYRYIIATIEPEIIRPTIQAQDRARTGAPGY